MTLPNGCIATVNTHEACLTGPLCPEHREYHEGEAANGGVLSLAVAHFGLDCARRRRIARHRPTHSAKFVGWSAESAKLVRVLDRITPARLVRRRPKPATRVPSMSPPAASLGSRRATSRAAHVPDPTGSECPNSADWGRPRRGSTARARSEARWRRSRAAEARPAAARWAPEASRQ